MHIMFVDESGTPPKTAGSSPYYFVVGGIIIPENVWHRLRDAMLGLKAQFKIRGEFKWRYFVPRNDDPHNPVRALNSSERNTIRTGIFKIISRERAVKSIVAICSTRAAYKMPSVNNQDDIYNLTYKTLTERFQYFLQDLSKQAGRQEYGVIIGDPRERGSDKRLHSYHNKLLYSSAEFVSNYKNLIESLFFQPSNLSLGIQFADMVAGAVWRKFERNDNQWFSLIDQTLRRGPKGEIDGYGLIKVPKRGWI